MTKSSMPMSLDFDSTALNHADVPVSVQLVPLKTCCAQLPNKNGENTSL